MKSILILTVALASSMSAGTIGLWSTGICSGLNNGVGGCTPGTLLGFGVNDNNYQLVSRADGLSTGTNSTITETATGTPYVPNSPGSDWIAPVPNTGIEPAGTFQYQTTFSLAGFVASSLVLTLGIAADDEVNVYINGLTNQIASCTIPAPGSTACFAAFTGPGPGITFTGAGGSNPTAWLNAGGTNTINFVVTNFLGLAPNAGASTPTGLRVELAGAATSSVPEPATYSLLGLGLAGLGLLHRKIA